MSWRHAEPRLAACSWRSGSWNRSAGKRRTVCAWETMELCSMSRGLKIERTGPRISLASVHASGINIFSRDQVKIKAICFPYSGSDTKIFYMHL